MTDFRGITDSFLASPQITLEDIAKAKALGITLIVNNRPDGEDPAAPQSADVASCAREHGLDCIAIPVGHSGFSENQIDDLIGALDQTTGKALAYCRSGTRSTLLWALAQAKLGMNPDEIARLAMAAGYDVNPIRPMLDMFASR